jgi:hypothetical protein
MGRKERAKSIASTLRPEKGLGDSQLTKRDYCYYKWMWMSRKFPSREDFSLGRGLPTVRGATEGFGGTVLWRPISMALPKLFC